MAEYAVATMAALGLSAIAGNNASPSLEIAFPIKAANGTTPFMYSVAIKTCGPHPGMKPTRTPSKGSNRPTDLNAASKSKPANASA